ncbi:YdcF family protein [Candidatus Woesearchaeota archaeon]|nr:YdcF family protein [Candidatus Woesearchaeota archaeon]
MGKLYECAIILGGGIQEDGTLPSWVIKRLKRAKELYDQDAVHHLVLCGKGRGEPVISEARLMKHYLREKGVAPEHLKFEERSEDTWQNAYFARTMVVDTHHWERILVITSEFHLKRTEMIFSLVFGDSYNLYFEGVDDSDIDSEKLAKRKQFEIELIDYIIDNILPDIRRGDLDACKEFFFNSGSKHYKEYEEFVNSLNQRLRTLY